MSGMKRRGKSSMKRAEINGSQRSYFGCLAHLKRKYFCLLIILDNTNQMKTESEALQPANYERIALEACRLARKMF